MTNAASQLPDGCVTPVVKDDFGDVYLSLIHIFPEFKKVVLASKMLRLSKLEQLILNAKRAGELRNDVDTSILAKNLLNISAVSYTHLISMLIYK